MECVTPSPPSRKQPCKLWQYPEQSQLTRHRGLQAPRGERSLFYGQANNCHSLHHQQMVSSYFLDGQVNLITQSIGKDGKMQTKPLFCTVAVAYECPCNALI